MTSPDQNPPGSRPAYRSRAGIDKGRMVGVKFDRSLRNLAGGEDPVHQQEWKENVQGFLAHQPDHCKSYSWKERQERMITQYQSYICRQNPGLAPEKYWQEGTFMKEWKGFFLALLTATEGRSGEDGETIRSTTLEQWVGSLLTAAGRKLVDDYGRQNDDNGAKVAAKVWNQLWPQKDNFIKHLVDQFQLVREPLIQNTIGRGDLLMIFRSGFQASEDNGTRASFIQTWAATVLVFHTGARIGSLGYSNKEYMKLGRYMKIEDVKINVEGVLNWSVDGLSVTADAGKPLQYRLDAVTKTHNLWFDAGVALLMLLLVRGALEGCSSVQDVMSYKGTHFRIKNEMKKEPLFVDRGPKGVGLGTKPAAAHGMTKSLNAMGKGAGINNATNHAIRRDAGNGFGLVLGAESARHTLGHVSANTTFDVHYSKGTLNYPLVQARLGELDHTASLADKIGLKRHNRPEQAARALLFSGGMKSDKKTLLDIKLTKEEERKIELSDDNVVKLDKAHAKLWDQYYELMPSKALVTHGQRKAESINAAFQKYRDHPKFVKNKTKLLELQKAIKANGTKRSDAVRKAKRPVLAAKRAAAAKAANDAVPSRDDLEDAVDEVNELMHSADNVPRFKPSERLPALNLNLSDPALGDKFLSDACKKMLAYPNLLDTLREEEADQEAELEEVVELPDDTRPKAPGKGKGKKSGGVEFQRIRLEGFEDADELEIWDTKLADVKPAFMEALLRPLVESELEQAIVQEHGGKWPCLLCLKVPPELRPASFGKNNQTQFNNKGHYNRHLKSHTRWFNLIIYMFTSTEGLFKCPLQDCNFTADTIPEVQEHCITQCEECDFFKRLKDHVNSAGGNDRSDLNQRKVDKAITTTGLPVNDLDLRYASTVVKLEEKELVEQAKKHGISPDTVRPYIGDMKQISAQALRNRPQDDIIRDPIPSETFDAFWREFGTLDLQNEIREAMDRVEIPDPSEMGNYWVKDDAPLKENPELEDEARREELERLVAEVAKGMQVEK